MEIIILVALIFVILNLANKYLKVPRDDNQRYDGINNRFYGEGYTGDAPEPPSDDEEQEDGCDGEAREDGREGCDGLTREDGRKDLQGEQADDGSEFGDDETGTGDREDSGLEEAGEESRPEAYQVEMPVQQCGQPHRKSVDQSADRQADQPAFQPADRQTDIPGTAGPDQAAPAGDAAIYGNIGNEPGVVIDTEVHIDATMPQDPGKS